MANLNTWEKKRIVERYTGFSEPFGAEERIFSIVQDSFPNLSMLDIGVGAGRTTAEFAPRCASYLGIDYSEGMINRCKSLFDYPFSHKDARDLSFLPDNSIDYVLFSFNGIDYVSYEDRMKILLEINRVCRGYFAFSTHNINYVHKTFQWDPVGNKIKYAVRFFLLHILNFPIHQKINSDYSIINDGVHRFGLSTIYIRPNRQVRDLIEAGFSDIRIFARADGNELHGYSFLEPHPYFLCRPQKNSTHAL